MLRKTQTSQGIKQTFRSTDPPLFFTLILLSLDLINAAHVLCVIFRQAYLNLLKADLQQQRAKYMFSNLFKQSG